MPSGEVYPLSSSSKSFSSDSTPKQHNGSTLDKMITLPSSSRSDDSPKIRTIAIAVEAHKNLRIEAFTYTFNHLIDRSNCKVVVLSCLSRLQSEMGVDYRIDSEAFAGVSKKVLENGINRQFKNINHFLTSFRKSLEERGVQLDIRVTAGPNSEDILVQAARALLPHWVVLDRSFARHEKALQLDLDCNLVLMEKPPKQPKVLHLNTKFLGPVEHIEDVCEEDPEHMMETVLPGTHSRDPSSNYESMTTRSIHSSVTVQEVRQTTQSNTTAKTFSCFTCWCLHVEEDKPDKDGPTKTNAVLYGETAPGAKAIYLGKMGQTSFKVPHEVDMITRTSSNTSNASNWFSSTASKKSSMKTVRTIEAKLEATMTNPVFEDDDELWKQPL